MLMTKKKANRLIKEAYDKGRTKGYDEGRHEGYMDGLDAIEKIKRKHERQRDVYLH